MAPFNSFRKIDFSFSFASSRLLLLLIGCSFITQISSTSSVLAQSATSGSRSVATSTVRLSGTINAFGMACVSTGFIPLSTQLPTRVEEVKKGSQAFYSGLLVGDRILEANIDKDLLKLKIERKGRVYQTVMKAKLDMSRPFSLEATKNLATVLRTYQIRLIVDHSGSMYRHLGNSDKLRWTWVKEELDKFCTKVQSQSVSKFDLYLFNNEVETSLNLSAKQVHDKLADTVTTGNTNLPEALKLATVKSSKPILILLVTDGQAVSSKENGEILAANLAKSAVLRRSKVVFLQAGYSPEGATFVASLNDALVARGMAKQAHTVLFEEASQKGILGTIEPILVK